MKSSRSGRGHQKTQHDKSRGRRQKHPSSYRNERGEVNVPTKEEVTEKTLKSLRGLGNQNFALSPFSQYFDDWLVNLREVLSVFESNPFIKTDEKFIEERSRVMAGIEGELIQKRLEEAELKDKMRLRSEKNHLLAEIDANYAAETREIKRKRNAEIENLSKSVSELEKQLEETNKMRASFFGSFSKKNKARKLAEAAEKLSSTKKELEMAIQNFAVEQERIHDEYERKKQTIIKEIQQLEKEIEKEETDTSLQQRQGACESLIQAVSEFLVRKTQN